MAKTRASPSDVRTMSRLPASMVLSQPASATPTVSWTHVDSYLVYQYGYKTGENSTQTQANIICYLNSQLVGYINFYPSDAVPESTIGIPNSNATTVLMLNFPLERFSEVIQTFRVEKGVTISVDTIQKVAVVGSGIAPRARLTASRTSPRAAIDRICLCQAWRSEPAGLGWETRNEAPECGPCPIVRCLPLAQPDRAPAALARRPLGAG